MSRRFFALGAASAVVASGLLGAALAVNPPPTTTVPPMRPAAARQSALPPHAVPGPIRTEPQPIAAAATSARIPDCHFPGLPLLCYASDYGD